MEPKTDIISSPRGTYQRLGQIGLGKSSTVYKIRNLETGEIAAMKIVENPSPRDKNEPKIMAKLIHPNIVKKIDDWDRVGMSYLVMEYADLGNLRQHLASRNQLSENEARDIFQQIIAAIEYAHQQGICHRDLKAENIVVFTDKESPRGKRISVVDWGLASSFSYQKLLDSYCGTIRYSSPEILTKQRYIGPEIDAWSLGVILYLMMSNRFPFSGETSSSIQYNIYSHRLTMTKQWSPELKDLLYKLLLIDSSERIRVSKISSHPWMNLLSSVENESVEGGSNEFLLDPLKWSRIYNDGSFDPTTVQRIFIRSRNQKVWIGENISSIDSNSIGTSEDREKNEPSLDSSKNSKRKFFFNRRRKNWLSRNFKRLRRKSD